MARNLHEDRARLNMAASLDANLAQIVNQCSNAKTLILTMANQATTINDSITAGDGQYDAEDKAWLDEVTQPLTALLSAINTFLDTQ